MRLSQRSKILQRKLLAPFHCITTSLLNCCINPVSAIEEFTPSQVSGHVNSFKVYCNNLSSKGFQCLTRKKSRLMLAQMERQDELPSWSWVHRLSFKTSYLSSMLGIWRDMSSLIATLTRPWVAKKRYLRTMKSGQAEWYLNKISCVLILITLSIGFSYKIPETLLRTSLFRVLTSKGKWGQVIKEMKVNRFYKFGNSVSENTSWVITAHNSHCEPLRSTVVKAVNPYQAFVSDWEIWKHDMIKVCFNGESPTPLLTIDQLPTMQ